MGAPDIREYEVKNVLFAWHGNLQRVGAILPVFVHSLLTRVGNASATVSKPLFLKSLSQRSAPYLAQRVSDAINSCTTVSGTS